MKSSGGSRSKDRRLPVRGCAKPSVRACNIVRGASMGDLTAQAIAVAVAMPFNFLGNKLWTFA